MRGLHTWKIKPSQVLTKRYPKNCLLTTMGPHWPKQHGAGGINSQPSAGQCTRAHMGTRPRRALSDLYKHFTMLKAIRMDVEHGCCPRQEWQAKLQVAKPMELRLKLRDEEKRRKRGHGETWETEAQFHLHFASLHHILTHLTLESRGGDKEIPGEWNRPWWKVTVAVLKMSTEASFEEEREQW